MSAFDDLDALMLGTAQVLFGDVVTLYPMRPGAAGPNGKAEADTDPARPITADVRVIRAEWAERVQIGGGGLPTPAGAFRLAAAGRVHLVTFLRETLPWLPRVGDELVYDDRSGLRYRLAEAMPDGGAGLHFRLSLVS